MFGHFKPFDHPQNNRQAPLGGNLGKLILVLHHFWSQGIILQFIHGFIDSNYGLSLSNYIYICVCTHYMPLLLLILLSFCLMKSLTKQLLRLFHPLALQRADQGSHRRRSPWRSSSATLDPRWWSKGLPTLSLWNNVYVSNTWMCLRMYMDHG